MLNFFVQLVNTIGLPVVLVGTYKAKAVLSGEFRQARRGTGQGDLVWDRMAEDDNWQLFVESLWRYQYTKKESPLTPELSRVMYDVIQGITDFAVKVYMLAQIRAITSGHEAVTAGVIRSVARDSLRLANPILSALRAGDVLAQHGVEDVCPIDIQTYLPQAQGRLQVVGRLDTSMNTVDRRGGGRRESAGEGGRGIGKGMDGRMAETEDAGTDDNTVQAHSPASKSKPEAGESANRGKRSRSTNTLGNESLPKVVAHGVRRGIAAHESLREAGHIRSADEFLKGEVAG